MADWKVALNGDDTGLEALSEIYEEDPKVVQEDSKYYVYYSDFNHYENERKVRSKAEDLRDKMWGVSRVRFNLSGKPTIGVVTDLSAKSVRLNLKLNKKYDIDEDSSEFINELLILSEEDPRAATLSRMISNGDNWVNLYRIYEFIQDNLDSEDDEDIIEKGWITENDKIDSHIRRIVSKY